MAAKKSHNTTKHLIVLGQKEYFDTVRGANYSEYQLKESGTTGKLYRYADFEGHLRDFQTGEHIVLVTSSIGDFVSVTRDGNAANCKGCLVEVK